MEISVMQNAQFEIQNETISAAAGLHVHDDGAEDREP
jgi:hypothetical protein